MTIKSKLIVNVLLTIAIIGAISLASYFSMSFLQEKLSYLTEKSTPLQMRTVELQRELQGCLTNLIKVNAARTETEYTTFREEAERSLGNVKNVQKLLEKRNGGSRRLPLSEEISQIAGEIFAAAEVRIKNDSAASEANARISQQLKESSYRLKELDTHIRSLQAARSAAFAKSLENTGQYSAKLRDFEEFRNHIKDLLSALSAAHNAPNTTSFLIAQGKIKTIMGRIARNKSGDSIALDRNEFTEDITEFLNLQVSAISKKDDSSKKWALDSFLELSEMLNRLNLTISQEIEFVSSKLTIETQRQGIIFAQSNSASTILLTNSELVALGLTATGIINRLFILGTSAELNALHSEINSIFGEIQNCAQRVETSLAKLDAKDELKMLHAAVASLAAIRSELDSGVGIMATLNSKLNAIEQANKSADKLHVMVIKQTSKGSESISAAQEEQEKSIVAVNDMVGRSLTQIVGIGAAAIIIGIFFGFWIYRSVLLPLRVILAAVSRQQEQGKEQASLAVAVAGGDLSRQVPISEALTLDTSQLQTDEMGKVLNAIVGMSEAQVMLDRAFAGMTVALRNNRDEEARRDRLKSGLHELNKILRDEHTAAELADQALVFLAGYLSAGVGIMYLYDAADRMLQIISTYALSGTGRRNDGFMIGEGLPGQVALERKMLCLTTVPPEYLSITSALGTADPLNVVILPIMHSDTLVGVLELGSFRQFDSEDFEFMTQALEGIAIAIKVNRSHQLVNDLLEQTQIQAEELRVQQEELQQTNEELGERARMLAEGNLSKPSLVKGGLKAPPLIREN